MYQAIMKKEEAVSTGKFSASMMMVMAAGGFAIGVLLMLTGLTLWAFSAAEQKNRDSLEEILILASFVFLGIGAHGLDLMNRAEREERERNLNI